MNKRAERITGGILKYKGRDFAVLCAVEEMAELSKALLKNINRGRDNARDVLEEIADVLLFLECIKKIYGFSDARILEHADKKIIEKWMPRIEKWKAEHDGD
jgi:NTP pyrophosphatase (non-canonical NTP hydrolase)